MQVPMAKLVGLGTNHGPSYFDADFSGDILVITESSRKQGPSWQKLHFLVVFDAAAA